MVIDTNAWAYLNVTRPICAWATYRGVLVPPDPTMGFVSVWTASKLWAQDFGWMAIERQLELARQQYFPDRVSRLQGAYVFPDEQSAQRAAVNWKGHSFQQKYLAEVHVVGGLGDAMPMDSNWITHAKLPNLPSDWMYRYWLGEPMPGAEPIWEAVALSRIFVLGTELRERAYQIISHYMPKTVAILEMGRLAAAADSDLGNISCQLYVDGDELSSRHLLDMRDATNEAFLQRVEQLLASGHPKREEALAVGAAEGIFTVPDVRPLEFRVPKAPFQWMSRNPT